MTDLPPHVRIYPQPEGAGPKRPVRPDVRTRAAENAQAVFHSGMRLNSDVMLKVVDAVTAVVAPELQRALELGAENETLKSRVEALKYQCDSEQRWADEYHRESEQLKARVDELEAALRALMDLYYNVGSGRSLVERLDDEKAAWGKARAVLAKGAPTESEAP